MTDGYPFTDANGREWLVYDFSVIAGRKRFIEVGGPGATYRGFSPTDDGARRLTGFASPTIDCQRRKRWDASSPRRRSTGRTILRASMRKCALASRRVRDRAWIRREVRRFRRRIDTDANLTGRAIVIL
jgi:hypothetical protein